MTEAPLVFVYLGNRVPKYAFHSLALARKNFQGSIQVLVDHVPTERLRGVEFVDISHWYNSEPFDRFAEKSPLDALFRGGFWLKAVERFFVLDQYQRFSELERFFHAELDVLVLDLCGFSSVLDSHGRGIFIPAQRPLRAIASLVYVNHPTVLGELLDFFQENSHLGNEMNMLGHFLARRSKVGVALPSENALNPLYWPVVEPAISYEHGLIDSLGFGPWLFGYDPRNVVGTSWNRFREGNEGVDLESLFFRASIRPKRLEVSKEKQNWIPIRAVHVHSKNFYRLRFPGVLGFYAWVARLPFRFPMSWSLGGVKHRVVTSLLSRKGGFLLLRLPARVRHVFSRMVVQLISATPKILSQRERRVASLFLKPVTSQPKVQTILQRSPATIAQTDLNCNFMHLLGVPGRDSRTAVEIQIQIFLDSLGLTEPALYSIGEGLVPAVKIFRGKKQALFVSDQKHYLHSKHALTFWSEHHLNNRWSFVGPFQLIDPLVVREMFPRGEQDVVGWAEMGLRAGMRSLSAFQSYGTYLFSRHRRTVFLAPFPVETRAE